MFRKYTAATGLTIHITPPMLRYVAQRGEVSDNAQIASGAPESVATPERFAAGPTALTYSAGHWLDPVALSVRFQPLLHALRVAPLRSLPLRRIHELARLDSREETSIEMP